MLGSALMIIRFLIAIPKLVDLIMDIISLIKKYPRTERPAFYDALSHLLKKHVRRKHDNSHEWVTSPSDLEEDLKKFIEDLT